MGKRHSGYQVPGGTLFQRIFLMVRGRSEISAEKVYLQVPGTQSAVFPFIYIGTQGASRYLVPRVPFSHSFTLVPRVPPYTTRFHHENMPMQYLAISHCCKNDNFQMKNYDIFLFLLKHRLWVYVRTASLRRF